MSATPSLAEVRLAVLDLRRSKSMVIEESDPNRLSAGSFFVNPVLDGLALARLNEQARSSGALGSNERVPSFPSGDRCFKVPAAWLIEKAGFAKGFRRGAFGISSAHALALVHHGGGTTQELVALAKDIIEGVRRQFDIELQPEPVFLGFPTANPLLSKRHDWLRCSRSAKTVKAAKHAKTSHFKFAHDPYKWSSLRS